MKRCGDLDRAACSSKGKRQQKKRIKNSKAGGATKKKRDRKRIGKSQGEWVVSWVILTNKPKEGGKSVC